MYKRQFLNRAVLYRQREDLTTEVVPVDIKAIMDGTSQNIILMKNDILYIPSIHDLEDRGNVVIPVSYTHLLLSDVWFYDIKFSEKTDWKRYWCI